MISTMRFQPLTSCLDTALRVLVQLPMAHEFSPMPLSPRLPTIVSVRVYGADGFQVRGPAAFHFLSSPPPARFVGTSFSSD
jgi:hypothetical protein